MKSAKFLLVVLGAGAWLAFGCGGDDDAGGRTSGAAGASTSGGAGGTSGKGSAGVAGLTPRGGNAGSAGNSARGGNAGTAGRGDGAGNGGVCSNEMPRHKLNDACPTVTTASGSYGDTLTTDCNTLAEACQALHCGEPQSAFDENGCYRNACYTSASCASGERCVAPVLLGQTDCVPSTYGDWGLDSGCECNFKTTSDCSENGYCLPAADYPVANDCVTTGKTCDELGAWASALEFFDLPGLIDRTDLQDALITCESKIAQAVAVCSGESGGGGMGGADGTAGLGGAAGQSVAGAGG